MPYKNQAQRRAYNREWMATHRGAADASLQLDLAERDDAPAATDPVEWIQTRLKVPSGPLRGQPFRLGEWQRRFIREALAPGIREAGLCVARKNGKSGLVAAILLLFLCGPLHRPDWRALVTSLTGRLAGELRDAVMATAEISALPATVRAFPPPGLIRGRDDSRCEFLAADKATGHASGADLAIVDEAGLLPEANRAMWDAMLSSVSGRDGRMMSISILGDSPMFGELEARADDPSVCWHGYTAAPDCEIDDEAVWHASNPGLADGIKSIDYMRDMARRALAVPASARAFRAYDLNAPGRPDALMLVQLHEWAVCSRSRAPRGGPVVVGLDLGGSTSMTAAALYWPRTGRLEAHGAFPGRPSLERRGKADGVGSRYERMAERGELRTIGEGRSTPVVPFLVQLFSGELAGQHVAAVVADRYRQAECLDAMKAAGIRVQVVWRANSFPECTADVLAFQAAVADRRIHPGNSLLLESAISESKLQQNSEGQYKLVKQRTYSRIDAASAALLAVGHGARPIERTGGGYLGAA